MAHERSRDEGLLLKLESGSDVVLKWHTLAVVRGGFRRDGRRFATAGWDKTVWVWDVVTRDELRPLGGHDQMVTEIRFLDGGNQLASINPNRRFRIWEKRPIPTPPLEQGQKTAQSESAQRSRTARRWN
jgi:WD40 repeat protein